MHENECLGLTDRANQVSAKAQQVKSGASDTMCNFNVGGDSFFEWSIETTTETYKTAYTAGSYKSDADFYAALASYFRTKLTSYYGKDLSSLTFISRTTASANKYALNFKATFARAISDAAQRTAVVSNIQTTYYEILTKFFASASKSMSVPKTAKLAVPAPVVTISKKAILTKTSGSTQSLKAPGTVVVKSVSSSSSSSSSSSKSSSQSETSKIHLFCAP